MESFPHNYKKSLDNRNQYSVSKSLSNNNFNQLVIAIAFGSWLVQLCTLELNLYKNVKAFLSREMSPNDMILYLQ